MPCRDYGLDEHIAQRSITELKERNDMLARIACEALTLVSERVGTFPLSTEASNWWKQHQIADKLEEQRKVKEQEHQKEMAIKAKKRREVLATLTQEQKELLGVK